MDTHSTQTPAAHTPAAHTPTGYPGSYPIYKPNSRGTGGVVRFSLNPSKAAMFVDAASQCGERQFAWEQKFTMKWDLSDIGAALSVLQRRQPEAKLFHQSDKASSICEFIARDEPNRAPYLLTLSRQDIATKDLHKVAIPLTHPEAAVLESVLQSAVPRILGW